MRNSLKDLGDMDKSHKQNVNNALKEAGESKKPGAKLKSAGLKMMKKMMK